RRNAHSFSLSELPLVLGMYFASPQLLISTRLVGALVALWLIRRAPPVKVVFNLALYAIEAEVAMWLLSILHPLRDVTSPHTWGIVIAIAAIVAMLGFSLTAVLISVAEGRLSRSQL